MRDVDSEAPTVMITLPVGLEVGFFGVEAVRWAGGGSEAMLWVGVGLVQESFCADRMSVSGFGDGCRSLYSHALYWIIEHVCLRRLESGRLTLLCKKDIVACA